MPNTCPLLAEVFDHVRRGARKAVMVVQRSSIRAVNVWLVKAVSWAFGCPPRITARPDTAFGYEVMVAATQSDTCVRRTE